jgi:thioredoxin-related protein
MKKLLLLFCLVYAAGSKAQTGNWQQALTAASSEHKNVLLIFSGSDWCIPCIRMEKEVFEKEAFDHYAKQHLVVVHADFPRLKKHQLPKDQQKQNEALAEQYNKQGSFPFTVLVDASGKVLKEWEGVVASSPKQFIDQLEAPRNVN